MLCKETAAAAGNKGRYYKGLNIYLRLPFSIMLGLRSWEELRHIFRLRYPSEATGSSEPITKDAMLLRGSRLRNTTFIEGIVLYAEHLPFICQTPSQYLVTCELCGEDCVGKGWWTTMPRIKEYFGGLEKSKLLVNERLYHGDVDMEVEIRYWHVNKKSQRVERSKHCHDTKVMMNNGRAPHKVSGIELLTNRFILLCMAILTSMVIGSALMSGIWLGDHPPLSNGSRVAPVIVPISLYITVEIIKLAQIFFLSQDIELYAAESVIPSTAWCWYTTQNARRGFNAIKRKGIPLDP
ncbi:hypothetical protein COOONC_00382 [Cooperia oncophora]